MFMKRLALVVLCCAGAMSCRAAKYVLIINGTTNRVSVQLMHADGSYQMVSCMGGPFKLEDLATNVTSVQVALWDFVSGVAKINYTTVAYAPQHSEVVSVLTYMSGATWTNVLWESVCADALDAVPMSSQTNYVYVVNDNSAEVQSYWASGLGIGGWIAAGLFGIWMIRVVVTDGSDRHEEES